MQEIIDLLNKFPKVTVLCVGDIMLDEFITGDVDRISPEAPIPVIRVSHISRMLGGMGNVAANIADLGSCVNVATVLGNDTGRQLMTEMLCDVLKCSAEHVEQGCIIEEDRPTTLKIRYIAESQQLLRADSEVKTPILLETQERILAYIEEKLPDSDIVVLSDYDKGVLSPSLCQQIIQSARAQGKKIIVDPKGNDYSIYAGATIITPNRKELSLATGGLPVGTDAEILAAGQYLIENCHIENVCATRSEQGMSLISAEGGVHNLPARALDVFDVSGAGDTVVATLAASLAVGATLAQAVEIANYAAGVVVGKVGTATVSVNELIEVVRKTKGWEGDRYLIETEDQILDQLKLWRARGYKIGFTNGVFDHLSPTHVDLLNEMRQHCDRLIVGVNSEKSLQHTGQKSVQNSDQDRARMLVGLASVDRAILFDEETPLSLIEKLQPDLLGKGNNYSEDEVVGAEFVSSYGGEIYLANIGGKDV